MELKDIKIEESFDLKLDKSDFDGRFMSNDCSIGRAFKRSFPENPIRGIGFRYIDVFSEKDAALTIKFQFDHYGFTEFDQDRKSFESNPNYSKTIKLIKRR